jgi:hypothetical protein
LFAAQSNVVDDGVFALQYAFSCHPQTEAFLIVDPVQEVTLSFPTVIFPGRCPVDIGQSNFDGTYLNGKWDIKIPRPQHFYLNGKLPNIEKGIHLAQAIFQSWIDAWSKNRNVTADTSSRNHNPAQHYVHD